MCVCVHACTYIRTYLCTAEENLNERAEGGAGGKGRGGGKGIGLGSGGRVQENSRDYLVCASRQMNPFLRNDFVDRTDRGFPINRSFVRPSPSVRRRLGVTLHVHARRYSRDVAAHASDSECRVKNA